MNINLIIISVASLVLLGLGGYLIHGYGQSKYHEGYTKAINEQTQAVIDSSNASAASLDRFINEANNLDNNTIDSKLLAIGIMRDYQNR